MRTALGAALGLVLTPVLTWAEGFALFGRRSTWAVGQGESFLVFLVALGAAVPGAVLFGIVAIGLRSVRTPRARVLLGGLSGVLWAGGALIALLLADRASL